MQIISRLRTFASIFFQVIAIAFTLFYYLPETHANTGAAKHYYDQYEELRNPDLFLQVSDHSFSCSLLKNVQPFSWADHKLLIDLPALELFTNKAINVAASLHNVFYLLISINAP